MCLPSTLWKSNIHIPKSYCWFDFMSKLLINKTSHTSLALLSPIHVFPDTPTHLLSIIPPFKVKHYRGNESNRAAFIYLLLPFNNLEGSLNKCDNEIIFMDFMQIVYSTLFMCVYMCMRVFTYRKPIEAHRAKERYKAENKHLWHDRNLSRYGEILPSNATRFSFLLFALWVFVVASSEQKLPEK